MEKNPLKIAIAVVLAFILIPAIGYYAVGTAETDVVNEADIGAVETTQLLKAAETASNAKMTDSPALAKQIITNRNAETVLVAAK
jgi:ABC-type Na+ efflux pump permease subunit